MVFLLPRYPVVSLLLRICSSYTAIRAYSPSIFRTVLSLCSLMFRVSVAPPSAVYIVSCSLFAPPTATPVCSHDFSYYLLFLAPVAPPPAVFIASKRILFLVFHHHPPSPVARPSPLPRFFFSLSNLTKVIESLLSFYPRLIRGNKY